jgi:hypothetical protein
VLQQRKSALKKRLAKLPKKQKKYVLRKKLPPKH